eukprot:gene3800-4057_t
MPTVGTELETLLINRGCCHRRTVTIREVGGCMRQLWPQYYQEATAVLFVADAASTPSQLEQAAQALCEVLQHGDVQSKPLCLLINKGDLPAAQSVEQVEEMLKASALGSDCLHKLMVLRSSALHGEGLTQVLQWIQAATASY